MHNSLTARIAAAFLLAALPAAFSGTGTVMTVCGPIDARELGRTLPHEHVMVDFIGAAETGEHRWDWEAVAARVAPYLLEAKRHGFQSLFECTPAYLGRDPELLKALSRKTGLHLITNTGYYGAGQNKFIPAHIQQLSADQLAAHWINESVNGIGETGIRPGFIKIAVDREPELSAMHEKLVRAACRTHLKTGLVIACHTGPSPVIFRMADVLEEEGVDPGAFIWVHATRDTPDNQIRAAKMGLWVSIDNVTEKPKQLDLIVKGLVELKKAGHLDRVLISHDAGWYRVGETGGGEFRPYTAIPESLLGRLEENGFNADDLDRLLIRNPRRAFAIRIRAAAAP
jgi:phosphotriesterase-related protein